MSDVVTLNTFVGIMSIEEDIKQKSWRSEFTKSVVNLIFTVNWITEKQYQIFKPYGLTLPQYNVMRILRGQHPKPCTINLIIDRMLDRMSNASRIVDKLESKELVIRRQSKKDRRAVDVIISQKGLNLLEKLDKLLYTWEDGFKNLTEDEARQLNVLLDKFRSST